jgi:hypothetical protein
VFSPDLHQCFLNTSDKFTSWSHAPGKEATAAHCPLWLKTVLLHTHKLNGLRSQKKNLLQTICTEALYQSRNKHLFKVAEGVEKQNKQAWKLLSAGRGAFDRSLAPNSSTPWWGDQISKHTKNRTPALHHSD